MFGNLQEGLTVQVRKERELNVKNSKIMEIRMVMFWVFIGVAIVAALVESPIDARKGLINHTISAWVRGIVAFGMSWYVFGSNAQYYYGVVYWFMLLVTFWIVFDPSYNLWKGSKWTYIGNSSKMDEFAREKCKEDGGAMYLGIKAVIMLFIVIAFSL